MSQTKSYWLRCRVDSGMFSDELAVTYPATGQSWQKSVFVPKSCVRQTGSEDIGEVSVKVLTQDGTRFAVLPSSQQDIVRVQDADLHS